MASGTIKAVVSKSDIVDNLTTNDSTKVLSAAQGYALNGKILEIQYVNTGTQLTSLDNIPVNSNGLVRLSSNVRPISDAGYYTYRCSGNETTKSLYVHNATYKRTFVNGYDSGSWSGWEELALNSNLSKYTTLKKSVNVNLFFVFGTVKDGGNYYTGSVYIPMGYKIADNPTLPSGASIGNDGNFYYLFTSSSSLAGKGTNIICSLVADS